IHGLAEGEEPAEAEQDVDAERDGAEQERLDREAQVEVADQPGQHDGEREQRRHDPAENAGPQRRARRHQASPIRLNRPAGRTIRTARIAPSTRVSAPTGGIHRLASPCTCASSSAATTAPRMLPMPPTITTAKASTRKSCPMVGKTA